MAKANLKKALATEKITEFGGICHGGSKNSAERERGSFNAFDICNFRILPDGTLEKRDGFSHIMTLPEDPRAFWSGYLDGEEMTFVLIGSAVYSADLDNGSLLLLGTVLSSEGSAEFFFYRGKLCLVDGTEFYCYDGDGFQTVTGYVPLYGKNLNGDYDGEIFEPINFLSDRIRVHYKSDSYKTRYHIGVKCSEIISCQKNGTAYDNIELGEDGMTFNLGGALSEGTELDIVFRLDESEQRRNGLIGTRRGTVYGGADDGKILLYGGEEKSLLYVSRRVSHESLIESLKADINSTDVYFPITDTVSVTDGRYPITALCRHYDRLLVFTEKETWMADFTVSQDNPCILPINSSVGCLSENGAVLGGNSPYSVSVGGIYRWTSDDDERNECNAVCISGEIGDMLDDSFFDHAVTYFLRERGEVWFADPDSEDQDVWVYSIPGGKWYRFDGIPVDSFFTYKGNVGMIWGRYIFAFSDQNTVDTGIGGKVKSNIEAYYESNLTDFGYSERTKHLKRVLVKADCDGSPFSITLLGDMGGEKTIEVCEKDGDKGKYPTYLDAHSGIGRFGEMNYIIRSREVGRTGVRALTLSAHK